ncbi:MAG: ferrous iron transport protein B [Cyclobacteriaceae bacterium]
MKITLVGNPNSGKTSVFNYLTGLNQRVGNYPGVTVDKKTGRFRDENGTSHEIIDLPGTYSLYPKTRDEEVVYQVFSDQASSDFSDVVVVVVDASNLERNLLLFSQLYDLKIPLILALNMSDVAEKMGIAIDYKKLSEIFGGVKVLPLVARKGVGFEELKAALTSFEPVVDRPVFLSGEFEKGLRDQAVGQYEFVEKRYKKIQQALSFVVGQKGDRKLVERHRKVDRWLTHPVWGYAVFIGVLFIIFQAIYAWSEWPMDLIDNVFLKLSQFTKQSLAEGVFTNLLAEGIIPGLGGVVIFIPQIALLFTFIFLLEESGYMSRVVFIVDRLMRPFGLNGRSIVPLISGVACAIPAIMATRTIDNWKERLITIMVTPLMSCSARLPVYTLLIAVVIPDNSIGPFNVKGMVLLGLYLIGIVAALLVALVFKWIIRSKQMSFLVMELPLYKMPRWNNLVVTLLAKVRIFVFDAGKVIFSISIILWVLATYGPAERMQQAESSVQKPINLTEESKQQYDKEVASAKLENSFIGILGKRIEPVIKPLGYNWQIGIALITSFAAREVFVGSMATIYSVGDDFQEDTSLLDKMRSETNRDGSQVYTLASGLSLMIFYAFAMQCMSTLAIVLRETKHWRWPLIQLGYMTALAYVSAFITFQLLQ